jgi:phosphoribosylanthranilate isomerase
MRVRVKICGVTTSAAARAAADAGADAVGLVFAESPRQVSVEQAQDAIRELPPFVTRVAVLRHPTPHRMAEIVRGIRPDFVQCEPGPGLRVTLDAGTRLLPVFHDTPDVVESVTAFYGAGGNLSAVLLEAQGRGGRGVRPDWKRAAGLARRVPLVLAGGLSPENVCEAILRVRPLAVDVSSGVESRPGVKDPRKIERFVAEVRRAESALVEKGIAS